MKNKGLIVISVMIIIISILVCNIISQNHYHLDMCEDENCTICNMIHCAQNLFEIVTAIIILEIQTIFIYKFVIEIKKLIIEKEENSLIFKKVQKNE